MRKALETEKGFGKILRCGVIKLFSNGARGVKNQKWVREHGFEEQGDYGECEGEKGMICSRTSKGTEQANQPIKQIMKL